MPTRNAEDTEIAPLLRVMASDLERVVAPDLSSAHAQFSLSLITKHLAIIARRLERSPAPAAGPADAQDAGHWSALIDAAEAQDSARMGGAVAGRGDGFVESGSGTIGGPSHEQASKWSIGESALSGYIRDTLPGYENARVADISRVAGGYSKDTFLVGLENGGAREDWVLRRDQAYSSVGSTVVGEYPLLVALSQMGLPVPKPLWIEAGAEPFGQAVMATSRLPGKPEPELWTQPPERARSIAEQAAALLGRLHAIALEDLPDPVAAVPGTGGRTPLEQVASLRRFWESKRDERYPLFDAIFQWLLDNAPPRFQRRSLVHGDFGFHNLLVDGDRITGILDWEFSNIGDAQDDLAWVRSFAEKVMPWPDFLRCYEASGGIRSDPAAERFYAVLGGMRIAIGCQSIHHAMLQGNPDIDIKLAHIGMTFARRFAIEAARQIEQAIPS